MPRLSVLGAQQQRNAAIKQAEDLEIDKMIRLVCDQVDDKTQPLPGSGIIVQYCQEERVTKAYRQENSGRIVFLAKDLWAQSGWTTKIESFRYGEWVNALEETYLRTKYLLNNQQAVDLERRFSPLEGDWNDP